MSTRVKTSGLAASSCFKPCRGDERPSSFQRQLMAKNNDVESMLVEGMKDLSFEQLQREQAELHGKS